MIVSSLIALLFAELGVAGKPPPAELPDSAYSKIYQDCVHKPNISDAELRKCGSLEFTRLDSELNSEYSKLAPKLEAARRGELQKAQRAWISFRDAQCSYESFSDRGATLGPLIQTKCLMRVTKLRIGDLKQMNYAEEF